MLNWSVKLFPIKLFNEMQKRLVNNSNQWKRSQSPFGEDTPAPQLHAINGKEFDYISSANIVYTPLPCYAAAPARSRVVIL
jgi:hypothetical protein